MRARGRSLDAATPCLSKHPDDGMPAGLAGKAETKAMARIVAQPRFAQRGWVLAPRLRPTGHAAGAALRVSHSTPGDARCAVPCRAVPRHVVGGRPTLLAWLGVEGPPTG